MSADARRGDARTSFDDENRPDLRVHVVRYADEPDRATLTPRAVSAADHTTTWLSIDADALVSLADAR
jgi:hypothetical protein